MSSKQDFLENRRKRVFENSISSTELKSMFPTKYWPGFSCSSPMPGEAVSSLYSNGCREEDCALDPMTDRTKMWDHVLCSPYCLGSRVPVLERKELPAFKSVNGDWDGILANLNNVGRPSGEGAFKRPSGKWIFDLVKMQHGTKLIEAAHAIYHTRKLCVGNPRGFLECLAEIVLADFFGLTVWAPTIDDVRRRAGHAPSFFDDLGMIPVVSTNMRKPWLTLNAVGTSGPVPFESSCAVLCGVHLEPQPWSAREGNPNEDDESWLEMNRWSCLPTIVTIDGWIFMDELMKAPLVNKYKSGKQEDVCVTMPVTALDGPSTLEAYLEGVLPVPDEEHGIWSVSGFIERKLEETEKFIPPFPCKECFRLNMASEGAPTRPMTKRPEKKAEGKKTEADAEWAAYDAKVDKIVRVVEKACEFHDIRFKYKAGGKSIRKKRRAKWNKLSSLLAKAESSKKRIEKYRRGGYLSKAKLEEKAFEATYENIADIMKGE